MPLLFKPLMLAGGLLASMRVEIESESFTFQTFDIGGACAHAFYYARPRETIAHKRLNESKQVCILVCLGDDEDDCALTDACPKSDRRARVRAG